MEVRTDTNFWIILTYLLSRKVTDTRVERKIGSQSDEESMDGSESVFFICMVLILHTDRI